MAAARRPKAESARNAQSPNKTLKLNYRSTMKAAIDTLTDPQVDAIVRLAWHDRTSFDEIRERTGLVEADVIQLMRRELEPRSFRLWRKRVSGRVTKHRKLLKEQLNPSLSLDDDYAL